jgi:50S ribosomal subunit-associated GTPase HflX
MKFQRGFLLSIRRNFGYTDTLAYRLYGAKKSVMVIHPILQSRVKAHLTNLLHADEAISLARAAKLDILPGPTEPRMGWDTDAISYFAAKGGDISEFVTVKDSDAESDDEMDMDDPLWINPLTRKQFAESSLVRVDKVDPVWFFGKGKVEEITAAISRMPPKYVFIDAFLTQAQCKQLEHSFYGGLLSYKSAKKQEYLEQSRPKQMVGYRGDDEAQKYEERISTYIPKSIEVFDRPRLILEIFATRSTSPLAKLQCDIAKMHFTKVNLGVGNLRKAREIMTSLQTTITPFKELPMLEDQGVRVDNSEYNFTEHKEKVDTLIRKLVQKAEEAKKARTQHRANRAAGYVTVGLVGYTNAGKTQLMNQLIGRDELRVRNLLFQTLDSATRSVKLPNGMTLLVTDSIGFIRDLPHFLFNAFKTTIEDVVSCDFIVHIRDIAHPLSEEQAEAVRKTLMYAGLSGKDLEERVVEVWNKIDEADEQALQEALVNHPQVVPVSALTGDGIDELINVLQSVATRISGMRRVKLTFPLRDTTERMRALRDIADVVYDDSLDCDGTGNFMSIDVLISPEALDKYEANLKLIE